ncbi:MAG: cation:proton antiporter [Planctomycetota bacterium]|nr:cation:proton antiporter [Planctomycetota bacterium]
MTEMVAIAMLLSLGMAAQYLAWRIRVPAIILLLLVGFAFGKDRLDVGIQDLMPDDLLFSIVSISVGLILFEGGLSLRMADLRQHGRTVMRLISLGALVTWALSTVAAYYIVGLPFKVSLLLGAILIVSGPTVVLPMLRHISPRGRTGPILTWEGIAIDPVGAVLAVLVYEGFSLAGGAATGHALIGLLKTVVIGGGLGALGGIALVQLIKRYWLPDHLQIPITVSMVVGIFVLSNAGQHESGLLAVTVMGVWAANSGISVRHILEFKEHLRVLLISSLFILLASRLGNADIGSFDGRWLLFLAALLFVVRPLAVWVSTRGSSLSREEKLFLAWMCPRGIVAAAVASVFGLALQEKGVEGANVLVPLTFAVIVGTVVVYGLTAGPLARKLGLAIPNPQGLLLVGAHGWAREIAAAVQKEGIQVRLVDVNRRNVRAARMADLPANRANVLDGHVADDIDLFGIGRVLALTPNDEVNTLIAMRFAHHFGRSRTYQLARDTVPSKEKPADSTEDGGRLLFGPNADYFDLSARFSRGRIRVTPLSPSFDFEAFLAQHGERALPLFAIDSEKRLSVATADKPLAPQPGDKVVALVDTPPTATDPV